ncbi:MAG: hypothetical protein QMC89_04430 [Candidatus Hodarchaeaceae archaeon]|nr:hypothetical protein [Candidatus Hodarchaeaceae archaeon]
MPSWIAESSCVHVPTIIIDPIGEFTGMLKENKGMEKELTKFKIDRPVAYSFAKVFTLDDVGIQFKANLLKKPDLQRDLLISDADITALIISQLVGDERLRDIIRESLIEIWQEGKEGFEEFIETVRAKAEKRRTAIKLDRLVQYRPLMSRGIFSIKDLLEERLVIFDLSSVSFTDSQKLMIMWFILKELLNHFLAQPHSDELKALLVCDEVHRFYGPDVPRNAAVVLENIVKQGRAKGLGAVMISQR